MHDTLRALVLAHGSATIVNALATVLAELAVRVCNDKTDHGNRAAYDVCRDRLLADAAVCSEAAKHVTCWTCDAITDSKGRLISKI